MENIPEFIARAKDKNDPFRLMGFGHRVYKNYDPRASVLRESAHEVLAELGKADDPLLPIAMELEKIALEDEYFVERKLFPNVDFYSGIILKAMGIPTSMFTAIFALARTVGWIAQWNEMVEDPEQKIGRPRVSSIPAPSNATSFRSKIEADRKTRQTIGWDSTGSALVAHFWVPPKKRSASVQIRPRILQASVQACHLADAACRT